MPAAGSVENPGVSRLSPPGRCDVLPSACRRTAGLLCRTSAGTSASGDHPRRLALTSIPTTRIDAATSSLRIRNLCIFCRGQRQRRRACLPCVCMQMHHSTRQRGEGGIETMSLKGLAQVTVPQSVAHLLFFTAAKATGLAIRRQRHHTSQSGVRFSVCYSRVAPSDLSSFVNY